ncbi:hypothetical protein BKA63DRAFT_568584 [Paraphoma chrysanthemicola]|nr:hypothetical protein BKA63DRAFT_568584 [Paraphoma chrysanthemicola]
MDTRNYEYFEQVSEDSLEGTELIATPNSIPILHLHSSNEDCYCPFLPGSVLPSLMRRAAVPTITFGAHEQYFPTQVSDPEPDGSKLQIFPSGIYDEFPKDGIVVSVGKDLRKQIQDTMSQSCRDQGFSQECHNALVPLLDKTDLAAHTKRFVVIGGLAIISLIIAVVALVYEMARIGTTEVPSNIKLNYKDLAQIQTMSGASTIAAVAPDASNKPYTITLQPPTTPTAAKDGHKAGDIVYRIPQDTADRIHDFLAMTGGHEAQKICQGQNLRRADTAEACIQSIERLAMNLADGGPSDLLQVAQQNVPVRPAAGQPIAIGVANLAAEGVPLIIPVYRAVYEHAPRRPNFDMPWNPYVLATGGAALSIAISWALYVPQSLTEIWIDGEKVLTDLKEDKLVCPRNIVCVADDCQGQKEFSKTVSGLYCKTLNNYGCSCRPVTYPTTLTLEADYMNKQYEWLEELVRKSELPPLIPNCINGEEALSDASGKFKTWAENFCKGHESLESSFTVASEDIQLSPGWKSEVDFRKKGTDKCPFDCEEMFSAFDTPSCITSTGIQKYGTVETDCGKASYGM